MSIKNAILMNESIFYPLMCAMIIILVSAVEHRAKVHQMAIMLRRVNFREVVSEVISWSIFLVISFYAYAEMSEGDPSVLLTWSAAFALFAYCIAWVGRGKDGALYLSPAFLALNACAIVVRLTTTTRENAYLPVDSTGDWLYQCLEGAVACACLGFIIKWGQTPQTMPISEKTWTAAALGSIACIAFGSQVYGDLANKQQADRAFAASIYVEAFSWFFQIHLVNSLPRHKVNAHFLVPVFMSNMCRAYFWHLAYPEVAPLDTANYMMTWFPEALCGVHYLLCAQTIYLLVACLLKIPDAAHEAGVVMPEPVPVEEIEPVEEKEEETEAAPAPTPEAVPATTPVQPATWDLATGNVSGGANPFEGGVKAPEPAIWNLASGEVIEPCRTIKSAAPDCRQRSLKEHFPELRKPCFIDYKEALPAGTTRFVQSRVVVENGVLRVDYVPA